MNTSIREILKRAVRYRGTQSVAAAAVGVHENTMNAWLNGSTHVSISRDRIDRLAEYCGLRIETLDRVVDLETGDIIFDGEGENL